MNTTDSNSKGPAQKLIDLQQEFLALQRATSDPEQRKQLSDLRKNCSAESRRLISVNLKTSAKEYEEAATGLEAASIACREAIDDVNCVQSAIHSLASAVELVSKIGII